MTAFSHSMSWDAADSEGADPRPGNPMSSCGVRLRPYQLEVINAVEQHQRPLITAPTGAGKTVIAAEIIRRNPNKHILFLAHRRELTGLLVITEKGRASTGPDRWPNKFALGWLPTHDGAATLNRWKSWRKPQAQAPIRGNIESSSGSATRETRRNPRPLVAETILAPGSGNDTGKLAETLNSPAAEALPGEMNLAGAA